MKKERIYNLAIVLTLLFLVLPAVSAHIEISNMGHYYDPVDGLTGYVDYQNVVGYNISGAVLVFIDGDIVAGEIIKTHVRYVAGFRCSPIKTLEFPVNEAEGDHTIVAYVFSMNNSIQQEYDYYTEGFDINAAEEEGKPEEEWLSCWGGE